MTLVAPALSGCAIAGWGQKDPHAIGDVTAKLTPVSLTHKDLTSLPPPRGKIVASVYGFRDQTGQYKPAPDSAFSTAVTQGAGSMLVKALLDSNWFVVVEREGLQNLLTERKIARAEKQQDNGLSGLIPSSILLEGGIVAYEQNVKTGGAGARYFGIGISEQYRVDQVTVSLRAVDLRTGRILHTVNTTKTIYSRQLQSGVFRFVSYQRLLELEAGFTSNEPSQLALYDAIEAAVVHLIAQGIHANSWALREPGKPSAVVQTYLAEQRSQSTQYEQTAPANGQALN